MTTKRAEQILNDISEDMCTATKQELIEVVKFQMKQEDKLQQKYNRLRGLFHDFAASYIKHLQSK